MRDLDWSDYAADGERARLATEPDGLDCDGDTCFYCDEPGEDQDPVAHFKHPTIFGEYVMAHGQCGEDFQLELA